MDNQAAKRIAHDGHFLGISIDDIHQVPASRILHGFVTFCLGCSNQKSNIISLGIREGSPSMRCTCGNLYIETPK